MDPMSEEAVRIAVAACLAEDEEAVDIAGLPLPDGLDTKRGDGPDCS
jgi:hypothetical protein